MNVEVDEMKMGNVYDFQHKDYLETHVHRLVHHDEDEAENDEPDEPEHCHG